jgi:FkbH-like protein
MPPTELSWLPVQANWSDELRSTEALSDADAWQRLISLANARIDPLQTLRLDRQLQRRFGGVSPPDLTTKPVRLAVLASSTVDHLLPSLRVGGLRRGLWLSTYRCDYGQYARDLLDPGSPLREWRPSTILMSFDAPHLLGAFRVGDGAAEADAKLDAVVTEIAQHWRRARNAFSAAVIQQAVLPVFPRLFGNNEHRLAGSPHRLVERLNERLRQSADAEGVDFLAVDGQVQQDGLTAWYDPMLWHRAKQEVHPAAAPLYGDLVGRILAAQLGRSFKCLVLDLDNTLWGGVIGDDGLDGIVLGQGSALGEAYISFQQYVRSLSARGVILAVCSKNDEANALEPFEKHPEMVLKQSDIACFSASWTDKATAIRDIAQRLNIGIDSLVFADDNPFERNIVRRELPMVGVPELPEDPALYASAIAAGGYFEALHLTAEDLERTQQYQANALRDSLKTAASDVEGYLRSLDMEMRWSRFDRISQQRLVQLINKTNQFNLTTRRYSEEAVVAAIDDPEVLSLRMRLLDQFGDNGIIAIVIGRFEPDGATILIDTWLMSCRVLGRQVEEATLNLIVAEASRLGASRLIGEYWPTAKNGMVKDHYARLGFTALPINGDDATRWELMLAAFNPLGTSIEINEE